MKKRTIGRDNAQTRRRARRAAARRETLGLSVQDVREIEMLAEGALMLAASGSTDLPLSDQDASWDAAAAKKGLSDDQMSKAFFWSDGKTQKLPFAANMGGTLTAIWKGVTSAAGAIQGARGGVSIPDADVAGVKAKIAAYYEAAAKKYGDDSIKVPWAAETVEWEIEMQDEIAEIVGVEELGGKPNKGTKPDKRLRDNKPEDEGDAAESTLDAIDAYQAATKCACGHAFSEHSGAGGTCGHEDGRGICRCGEFSYPEADVSALAAAILAVRPDLAEHIEQVIRIAERTLLSLHAAAGDVAWGPEDGFVDLMCDVNETLSHGAPGIMGPRCVDVGVKLDKVQICDGDDTFVAPITIDAQGEPVLSDRSDWIYVEEGLIETAPDDADDSMSAAAFKTRFLNGWTNFAPVAEMPEAAEVLPEASDEITPPEAPAEQSGDIPWHATFVPEGKLTEDGRAFAPGSILIPGSDEGARDLPLTLMAMIETSAEGGHDGAKVAGRIDSLYRTSPNVEADGVFSNEEYGQQIARMVESQELKGLSVDIAPLQYDWVPRDQYFSEGGDFIGVWNGETDEWAPAPGTEHLSDTDDADPLAQFFGEDDRVLLITRAVIGMATVCPFPAFGGAQIALTAAGMPSQVIVPLEMSMPAEALTAAGIPLCDECRDAEVEVIATLEPVKLMPDEVTVTLTAAAAGHAPVAPPVEWFENPEFEVLTPLTITDDGRVFGHAWQWETCHLSFDKCVTAPHSETEYAYFQTGEVACDGGERLQVGRVTYDTGHANVRLSRLDAVRHYDDTGTVAALVQFGEDEHGGWFAGAVVADMPDEDLQRIRACGVSGDWRGIDGNLELVALLSVPVGGFPVPRGAITAAGDEAEPLALVAAGIVDDARLTEIRRLAAEVIETGEAEVPEVLSDEVVNEIANLTVE